MAGATKRTSQNSVTAGLQTGRKRPAQRGGRRSLRIGLFFGEMGIYGERAIEAISAAAELHNGKIRILVGRLREISPADVPAGRLDGVILGWWDHPDDLLELL